MNLNLSATSRLKFSALSSSSRPQPKIPKILYTTTTSRIPARDIIIDLGKHKGKMLGTLPSNYLKWISKNLRAGETEEWAKLADQVLNDPVYRDRIEWEFAENILQGNSSTYDGTDSVSQLLELSERFGWDNDDKAGWSRIDFGLLGTSKGGRIPRLDSNADGDNDGSGLLKSKKNHGNGKADDAVNGGERRRDRRERSRQRRLTSDARIDGKESHDDDYGDGCSRQVRDNGNAVVRNRFPGRDSLINKVLNRHRMN